jgi:DNA-binding response OmpR family regulator
MRILVVDDDLATRKMLRFLFEHVGGYEVIEAEGAVAAERALDAERFDAVTLDVLMPDGDGLQLCRQIRRISSVPILMLSARSDVLDRVQGLKFGADDYVGKPFDPSELLARVEAMIRRARRVGVRDHEGRVQVGDLTLDPVRQTVGVQGGAPVELTPTEFRLLLDLALAGGEPRTREQLETAVWGEAATARPNTVESYISDLRRKLEADPRRSRYLLTVRGRGYRLVG